VGESRSEQVSTGKKNEVGLTEDVVAGEVVDVVPSSA
jgi:hypothetical protein